MKGPRGRAQSQPRTTRATKSKAEPSRAQRGPERSLGAALGGPWPGIASLPPPRAAHGLRARLGATRAGHGRCPGADAPATANPGGAGGPADVHYQHPLAPNKGILTMVPNTDGLRGPCSGAPRPAAPVHGAEPVAQTLQLPAPGTATSPGIPTIRPNVPQSRRDERPGAPDTEPGWSSFLRYQRRLPRDRPSLPQPGSNPPRCPGQLVPLQKGPVPRGRGSRPQSPPAPLHVPSKGRPPASLARFRPNLAAAVSGTGLRGSQTDRRSACPTAPRGRPGQRSHPPMDR